MGPLKSPRPNALGASFYQRHWPIVGEDVCNVVLKILDGEGMNSKLNSTFIALIPKKSKPEYVNEFWLINLCNILYKLVSKVIITIRLKPLMNSIISSNQNAFILSRIITDNIILTHELTHFMRNFKKGRVGKMAVKLDISK